jgi:hypothetical protein
VEISCRIYKPRRPRESPLYRLVEQHLEELLRVWPVRFVRQHGALRPMVERVLREFLKCGLLEHGFARLWCSQCRKKRLMRLFRERLLGSLLDRRAISQELVREAARLETSRLLRPRG